MNVGGMIFRMRSKTDSSRRAVIKAGAFAAFAGATGMLNSAAFAINDGNDASQPHSDDKPLFQISLAQWSLNRRLFGGTLKAIDFPRIARDDYNINAVEYVNQFYKDKVNDQSYLRELRKRADDAGVRSLLIMCDGEGRLGDPDDAARSRTIEHHRKWLDWAAALGCHSIRVNAASTGAADEQRRLAADGLARLTAIAAELKLNVIVENHGGLSSNGAWLASVIRQVDHPRCGTLPDFGNFRMFRKPDGTFDEYDRYQGVRELMPFAKGVSAKSYDFNEHGEETTIDFLRMMKIVVDSGYRGHVGIEYEGDRLSEPDGIRATRTLLERVRETLKNHAAPQPD